MRTSEKTHDGYEYHMLIQKELAENIKFEYKYSPVRNQATK